MVSKICPWDGGVCYHKCCESILPSGLIVLCEFHGNEFGRSVPRRVKRVFSPLFNKHLRGDSFG
jgi:hypothetical protein